MNSIKSLEKVLGWIIDSVIDHTINISKCKPLNVGNYIRLPKGLDHPRKGLIKQATNCISSIICLWSLFCSVRVYASLHFLPILLEK